MRIGVTGNYASGKGTVCSIFELLGGRVIDTDLVAREIVEPGTPALRMIAETFGGGVIQGDGTLDRQKLAALVFSRGEMVEKLNAITHPRILELTLSRSVGPEVYFINAPLLFEAGFDRFMDYNIVVYSERGVAALRGEIRDGISTEQVSARTAHQFSFNEIKGKADFIIDNNADLERTHKQVVELWKTIQTLKCQVRE